MEIEYYYKKQDGTLGQLVDEKEGSSYRIKDSIDFIKETYNVQRAFGLIRGVSNENE
jgi:hypothetical protein